MRIFIPYTNVQGATLTALNQYLWNSALFVDVSKEWGYPQHFRQRWNEGETFINVEHDVVPWLGAIEELWHCPHDWCCFTYCAMPGEPHPPPPPIGLVKFSDKFIQTLPDVWEDYITRYDELKAVWDPDHTSFPWNHLDMHLFDYAQAKGIDPHPHWPSVVNAKPTVPFDQQLGVRIIKADEPLVFPKVVDYDQDRFDFVPVVQDILGTEDLAALDGKDFGITDLLTNKTNQSTIPHKLFYAGFDGLGDLYRQFVRHMAMRYFNTTEIYYQAVPTFRVHFPNNLAVGEIHCDSDYNHQDGEINFWVPLTEAFDSNTVWIEGSRGAQNYQPWELKPGQLLVFDGVNWSHGNMRNRTGASRVSFDFRMILKDKYRDTGLTSINGRKMTNGDYWSELIS